VKRGRRVVVLMLMLMMIETYHVVARGAGLALFHPRGDVHGVGACHYFDVAVCVRGVFMCVCARGLLRILPSLVILLSATTK
jgi:hypothetical protein